MNWPHFEIANKAVTEYRAVQKILELSDLSRILRDSFTVLEIGSYLGGTLWFWHLRGATKIVSIDDRSGVGYQAGRYNYPHCMMCSASSHNPKTRELIEKVSPFDIVFIDGDHSLDGCTQDYEWYGSMATEMVILHDICPHPDVEVPKLWAAIKEPGDIEIIHPPESWGGLGIHWKVPSNDRSSLAHETFLPVGVKK